MPVKQTKLEDRSLIWLINYHNAITRRSNNHPDYWETMIAYVEQLIKEKQFKKEKGMKLINIKFDNKLLVNYVVNKLQTALDLKCYINESGDYAKVLRIDSTGIHKATAMCTDWNNDGSKTFVITCAANTDTIIEEVIKEYRKPEYKGFNIGGGFNGNKLKVKVYEDKVNFNGQDMSFDAFINMRNALTLEYGGFKIGGETTLQLTNANTGTKVYVNRDELQPIVETILGKL